MASDVKIIEILVEIDPIILKLVIAKEDFIETYSKFYLNKFCINLEA